VVFSSNTVYEIALNTNQPGTILGLIGGEILDFGMPGSPAVILGEPLKPPSSSLPPETLYVPPGTYSYTAIPVIIKNTTNNALYGCLPYDKYGSVTVSGNTPMTINYECWIKSVLVSSSSSSTSSSGGAGVG